MGACMLSSEQQLLRDAAATYGQRGWTAIPLENDTQGYPKKPFIPNWTAYSYHMKPFPDETWLRATGLGLVLGARSGGLAVIDIDDEELAAAAFPLCRRTRCVLTIRRRGHVYVIEETISTSTAITVQFKGRAVKVELKTTGTQVAAPPTPGYNLVHNISPINVSNIAAAWERLRAYLNIDPPDPHQPHQTRQLVWAEQVPADHRNNTMYLEAHRLREAGMPLEQALEYLRLRWERHYQAGNLTWQELDATIQSAYRKGAREEGSIDNRNVYQLWSGGDARNADGAKPDVPH